MKNPPAPTLPARELTIPRGVAEKASLAHAPAQPAAGELVEPREAWLPQEARELFTERSRLLVQDPYLLHAPPNTQRARRADWALFCDFCETHAVPAMPASPATVVAFLEAAATTPPLPGGRPRQERVGALSLGRRARRAQVPSSAPFRGRPRATARAAKTLERYTTSIATAHRLAEQADPTRSARARNALHALMGDLRAPKPRAPLRRPQLLELMAGLWPAQPLPSGAGRAARPASAERESLRRSQRGWLGASLPAARLWDLRAGALLACLYPTMARRSELVELRCEDLPQIDQDGVVPIHSRKTKQDEHRYLDALALRSVSAWCQAAGITSGPVFRELGPTGRIGQKAMSPQQMVQIVRACWAHRCAQHASRAGPPADDGLSMAQTPELGAHSTRIGAAHDLVASGQDVLAIMHSGGWQDPRMPRKYIQALQAADSGMARMLRAATIRPPHAVPEPQQPSKPAARRAKRSGRARTRAISARHGRRPLTQGARKDRT